MWILSKVKKKRNKVLIWQLENLLDKLATGLYAKLIYWVEQYI